MPSPFEALINAPTPAVPSNIPTSVVDPGIAGLASNANANLQNSQTQLNASPSRGLRGFAGDMAMAKQPVSDAVGALSAGSQALVNIQKIHQDKNAMMQLKNELQNYGIDNATMAQIDATIGDGSDASKNEAAMQLAKPYIAKVMSGKRLQKFKESDTWKNAVTTATDAMQQFDAENQGEKDPVILDGKRRQVLDNVIENLKFKLLSGTDNELTPDETKSVLDTLKSIVPKAQAQQSNKGNSRVWGQYNNWKQKNNLVGLSSNMAMYNNAIESPVISKQFDPDYINKIVEEHGIVDQEKGHSNKYLLDMYNKGVQEFVVKNDKGDLSTVVLLSSPQAMALSTALAPIANDIVKKRSGGQVTRTNLLRTMGELGLGEFAKWDILAAEGKGSDKLTADDIASFIQRDINSNNRWISPEAVLKAMRNSISANKINWDNFYTDLPDEVKPLAQNELKNITDVYDKMLGTNPQKAKLWRKEDKMVDIESEPLNVPVGNKETLGGILSEANKFYKNGSPQQLAQNVGKVEGLAEGNKTGTSATVQTSEYALATELLKNIEEHGKTSGDRRAYEELIDANYGTRKDPIYLDQALTTEGLKNPTIRAKVAAKFNAAGQDELAKYILGGDATLEGLKTIAEKVGIGNPTTEQDVQKAKGVPVNLPPKEGSKSTSKGVPIIFRNGKWVKQ